MIFNHQCRFVLLMIIGVQLIDCEKKSKIIAFADGDPINYNIDDFSSPYHGFLDSPDSYYASSNEENSYEQKNSYDDYLDPYINYQGPGYTNKPLSDDYDIVLGYDFDPFKNTDALNFDDHYSKRPQLIDLYPPSITSPSIKTGLPNYDTTNSNYRPQLTSTSTPVLYTQYNNKYDVSGLNPQVPYGGQTSSSYNQHQTTAPNKPPVAQNKDPYLNPKVVCYDSELSCVPLAKCPITRFDDLESIQSCSLPYEEIGICCPPAEYRANQQPPNIPISRKATKAIFPKEIKYFPNVNKQNYRSLTDNYNDRVKYVKQIERSLKARKLTLSKNTPEMAHHNFFGFHKEAQNLGRMGERSIVKAYDIAKNYFDNLSPSRNPFELYISTNIDLKHINATDCPSQPHCLAGYDKYRTPDGSCNNRFYPSWGKSFTPYNRVLNPSYGDGINSPRLSTKKQELPNPRELSVEFTDFRHPPSSRLTSVCMQYGQFIDHDFASAAPTRTNENKPISCCNPEIRNNPGQLKHPACYEVPISKYDPFYGPKNVTCMNFVRSVATPRSDCKLAPREQLNQPTSFIDGSQIYGSSKETMKSVRTFHHGQLLSSRLNSYEYLPRQMNGTCNVPNNDFNQCFRAGDPRVNENIDLAVIQTVFMRCHNHIAYELHELNPHWNDEYLYQEARRIVGAFIQHITYSEFLPVILNKYIMKLFDLYPTEEGFINKYNPKINPSLFNAFPTAAYRLHSTIAGSLELRDNYGYLVGKIPLSKTFNDPRLLTKPYVLDYLINGMCIQPMQEVDGWFTEEVCGKLFKPWNGTAGFDIYTLNIQRGRDHGLKGYTAWVKQCGLGDIRHFDDMDRLIPKYYVNKMKRLYYSVHDVDLYAGMIVENHMPNSEVGPTMGYMIAEQFRRLKYGDSYWYENEGLPSSFTAAQLAEIKKITLARIFCDFGDNIEYIQPHVFIVPKYWWNKRVSCNNLDLIPKITLLPWLDKKY